MTHPAPHRAGRPLEGDWFLAGTDAEYRSPPEVRAAGLEWAPIPGPAPVASLLAGGAGTEPRRPLDDQDWWYRCRFNAATNGMIHFEGLATLAEVWIDDQAVFATNTMFEPASVPVTAGRHEIVIRFASITRWLGRKRPRPAWKTRLVEHQQLRWLRTSLLGRIPAWCPPTPIIGPWRPIRFEPLTPLAITSHRIRTSALDRTGSAEIAVRVRSAERPTGTVMVGTTAAPLQVSGMEGGWELQATVTVPGVRRWWPHTHGDQPLYDVRVVLESGASQADATLARVGFRTLEVDRGPDGHGFGLRINGVEVFCRGTCWTPPNLEAGSTDDPHAALEPLRAAGMNMVRIGGTMTWESDGFHDACDALGILVWHDLMFANMDYPVDDAAFRATVTREAETLFARLQGRPSTAVICGSSEVEQQAAMLGLGPERWTNTWFDEALPARAAEWLPDAAWVRSSPSGGTLPFHVDQGVSHYYGVGAYRRPLTDARLARVRFASECLALSNVPEPGSIDQWLEPHERAPHHPRWKAGVPRDPGAGWDFEDVRDHYVETIFGLDAGALRDLRWVDPDRYLELGRVTSGEVMARTLAEWRRPGSDCRGALVWFHRDLQPGAGWGLLDHTGHPKAAYWYFERAARPLALLVSDEGLNGLAIHLVNERASPFVGSVRVTAYRDGRTVVDAGSRDVRVDGRAAVSLAAEAVLGGFRDLTWAYRFGPPAHDVVAVSLLDPQGAIVATECFWPGLLPATPRGDAHLSATPSPDGHGLVLESDAVLTGVAIRVAGARPGCNYLALEPAMPVTVPWIRATPADRVEGWVSALQLQAPVRIAPC